MKKKYIAPQANTVLLELEEVVASSPEVILDNETTTTEAFSASYRSNLWSSDNE